MTTEQREQLEQLFEVRLQYKEGKPAVSMNGKVGDYVGSGEGSVSGANIRGDVHWTLFEAVRPGACDSNLFGVITTEDGAEIRFDTMGFFRRPDKERSHLWVTSAAVRFETDDVRYAWLTDILGVWEGTLDMRSYKHHYRVFAPALEPELA